MDIKSGIQMLEKQSADIAGLVAGIEHSQAVWKPDPETWSILEVMTHLHDEEIEDFRKRLDGMLHRPDEPWSPIDPAGWVIERSYNSRALAQSLDGYLAERRRSIEWLADLGEPDLERVAPTPWGSMPIGNMFAAWVAHDLLHMRQLVELKWAYAARFFGAFDPQYAGDW
jgi:hypothetical protein